MRLSSADGIGIWQWAGNDEGSEPDVVMACCGETPTLEFLRPCRSCASTSPRSTEEGTVTTALDMRVQNELDRFHLVQNMIDRLPQPGADEAALRQIVGNKLAEHQQHEIVEWKWNQQP